MRCVSHRRCRLQLSRLVAAVVSGGRTSRGTSPQHVAGRKAAGTGRIKRRRFWTIKVAGRRKVRTFVTFGDAARMPAMCYAAMARADLAECLREYDAVLDTDMIERLYWERIRSGYTRDWVRWLESSLYGLVVGDGRIGAAIDVAPESH